MEKVTHTAWSCVWRIPAGGQCELLIGRRKFFPLLPLAKRWGAGWGALNALDCSVKIRDLHIMSEVQGPDIYFCIVLCIFYSMEGGGGAIEYALKRVSGTFLLLSTGECGAMCVHAPKPVPIDIHCKPFVEYNHLFYSQ